MKPSQLLQQHREAIRLMVEKRKGANPRVFGPVARGEDTEDSDLDILIDDQPGRLVNLFDLGGRNYELSQLLGVNVDVLPAKSLPDAFRKEVLDGAMSI